MSKQTARTRKPRCARIVRKYTQNVGSIMPKLAPWVDAKTLGVWLKGERAALLGAMFHENSGERGMLTLHAVKCPTMATGDDEQCRCCRAVLVMGGVA